MCKGTCLCSDVVTVGPDACNGDPRLTHASKPAGMLWTALCLFKTEHILYALSLVIGKHPTNSPHLSSLHSWCPLIASSRNKDFVFRYPSPPLARKRLRLDCYLPLTMSEAPAGAREGVLLPVGGPWDDKETGSTNLLKRYRLRG